MSGCTPATLAEVVARYGVLRRGGHDVASGECCILEAVSVCDGVPWTDDPDALDRPDVSGRGFAGGYAREAADVR